MRVQIAQLYGCHECDGPGWDVAACSTWYASRRGMRAIVYSLVRARTSASGLPVSSTARKSHAVSCCCLPRARSASEHATAVNHTVVSRAPHSAPASRAAGDEIAPGR